MFTLEDVPTTIRPKGTWENATTAPRGPKGKPLPVTECKIPLELDLEGFERQLGEVFPNLDEMCKNVAGQDATGGIDLATRTKVGSINVALKYDGSIFFEQSNCQVMGKPKVFIDKKGEAKLMLAVRVKADEKEMGALSSKINASCFVDIEPSQVDLSDKTELATPAPSTRVRPKLAAVAESA